MSSAKALTPGAALLRTSRLFSLPTTPVPKAPGDYIAQNGRFSPTATQPFPTVQSIGSIRSARERGDWGLKRNMPPKALKGKIEPCIRINELDSIESVTDYSVANNHLQTVRKWQELHVPLTAQTDAEQKQNIAGKSVFEESHDMISIDPAKRHTDEDKRWKFQGPWLAGVSEGDSQKYIKKKVRTQRGEFREFLREQLAANMNTEKSASDMDRAGLEDDKQLTAEDITDEQLTDYLRKLRHERHVLYRLVGKFLDLAPVEPSDKTLRTLGRSSSSLSGGFLSPLTSLELMSGSNVGGKPKGLFSSKASASVSAANPWTQDGPPMSHPSAGLSYLRTAAFLDNHPVYGPQKFHPPQESRVLTPRTTTTRYTAKLGVAGFVVESPFGETAYNNTRHNPTHNSARAMPALSVIDPTVYGGAKVHVRVATAKVNSQGRIRLSIAEPDPEAVLVQNEIDGKEKIHGQSSRLMSTRADSQPRLGAGSPLVLGRAGRTLGQGNNIMSSAENYGLN